MSTESIINKTSNPTMLMGRYAQFSEKVREKHDGQLKWRHWFFHPILAKQYSDTIVDRLASQIELRDKALKILKEAPRNQPFYYDGELKPYHVDYVCDYLINPQLTGTTVTSLETMKIGEYVSKQLEAASSDSTTMRGKLAITNELGGAPCFIDKKSIANFFFSIAPSYIFSNCSSEKVNVKIRLLETGLTMQFASKWRDPPENLPWFQLLEIAALSVGGSVSRAEGSHPSILLAIPRTIETGGKLEFKI